MLWLQVRQWAASSNVTFQTEDVKLLCEQEFGQMGETEWRPVCDQAKRTEIPNLETEGIIDLEVDSN
jgi:hypothetical protein